MKKILVISSLLVSLSIAYADTSVCSKQIDYLDTASNNSLVCDMDGLQLYYSPILGQSYFYNNTSGTLQVSETYLGNTTGMGKIPYTAYPTDGKKLLLPPKAYFYIGDKGVYDDRMGLVNVNDKIIGDDVTFASSEGYQYRCNMNTQKVYSDQTSVLVTCDKVYSQTEEVAKKVNKK